VALLFDHVRGDAPAVMYVAEKALYAVALLFDHVRGDAPAVMYVAEKALYAVALLFEERLSVGGLGNVLNTGL
jgi:hypothetical protein